MNKQPGRTSGKYLDGWIRRCLRCLCWRQLGIFNWHLPTIWISVLKEDTGDWEPGFKASVYTIVHSNKYVWNSDISETSQSSWFGFPDNPHRTNWDWTDTFTVSQLALYLSLSPQTHCWLNVWKPLDRRRLQKYLCTNAVNFNMYRSIVLDISHK